MLSSKQAWRLVIASLLFAFSAGCAQPATPTPAALPTPQALQPTATRAASATPPTVQETPTVPFTYSVQEGDTVSSIAAEFGLQPETVLWANFAQLLDSPDLLFPGMELLILPVDGLYHQVGGTDTVDSIAAFFATDARAILDWPGNEIDPGNPVIFAGQWLVVPGGQRFLRRRLMPNLPAYAMAVSPQEFGSGTCPQNADQPELGDGQHAWPAASHEVVGEAFWSAHPAVDLEVADGEEVRASDAGIVVFSGWSNFGYGYMVMLDHGNGDFSLYGGLGAVTAICGHTVEEGEPIGLGGVIGHPAGSFVHFEIRRGEDYLHPLEILP
ncbi:MAG: peptidoglycan DD-metalloendopeptidase family protein [Anaerolineales bacterium]